MLRAIELGKGEHLYIVHVPRSQYGTKTQWKLDGITPC